MLGGAKQGGIAKGVEPLRDNLHGMTLEYYITQQFESLKEGCIMVDYNNYGGGGDNYGSNSPSPTGGGGRRWQDSKTKIDMPGGLVGTGVFLLLLILPVPIMIVSAGGDNNTWFEIAARFAIVSWILCVPAGIVTAVVFDRWNTFWD